MSMLAHRWVEINHLRSVARRLRELEDELRRAADDGGGGGGGGGRGGGGCGGSWWLDEGGGDGEESERLVEGHLAEL